MKRRILLCMALWLVMLPSWAASVNVDFDKSADFSKYKTYGWTKGTDANSAQVQQFIVKFVNQQLQESGLTQVTEGEPDVYVLTHAISSQGFNAGAAYIGLPNWGGGIIMSDPSVYTAGTLVVDLKDPATEEPIWRAIAQDTFGANPQMGKVQKKLDKLTSRMFRNFPPK